MKKAVAVMMTFLLLCLLFAGCNRGDGAGEPSPRPSSSPPVTAEPPASPEVSPPPSPSPAMPEEEYADIEHFYTIPLGDIWWTVDQNGNTVSEETRRDRYGSRELTDMFTGERRYDLRTRLPERDADVEPQYERALFELTGAQLTEWSSEYEYDGCFDSFVLRRWSAWEDYVGGAVLFDMDTGETVHDFGQFGYLQPFGEWAVFTPWTLTGGMLIFFDRQWNTVDSIEVPQGYDFRIYGDCLYVKTRSEVLLAIDSSGNDLSESPFFPHLASNDAFYADTRVYLLAKHDGGADGIRTNSVYNSETGEQIGEPFRYIMSTGLAGNGGPAFIGYRDSRALLLDGGGAVLAESAEIDGLDSIQQEIPGVYSFSLSRYDGLIYEAGLLDENLDPIPLPELYESFNSPRGTSADTGFIVGGRRDPLFFGGGALLSDILSPSGEVAVKNLRNVFEVGPGRFAVQRGYDVGLMDWNGNWIVRRSVFNELED